MGAFFAFEPARHGGNYLAAMASRKVQSNQAKMACLVGQDRHPCGWYGAFKLPMMLSGVTVTAYAGLAFRNGCTRIPWWHAYVNCSHQKTTRGRPSSSDKRATKPARRRAVACDIQKASRRRASPACCCAIQSLEPKFRFRPEVVIQILMRMKQCKVLRQSVQTSHDKKRNSGRCCMGIRLWPVSRTCS